MIMTEEELLREWAGFVVMEKETRDALMRFFTEHERLQAKVARLVEALEIIAGERQCIDSLMSNADVACAALAAVKAGQL